MTDLIVTSFRHGFDTCDTRDTTSDPVTAAVPMKPNLIKTDKSSLFHEISWFSWFLMIFVILVSRGEDFCTGHCVTEYPEGVHGATTVPVPPLPGHPPPTTPPSAVRLLYRWPVSQGLCQVRQASFGYNVWAIVPVHVVLVSYKP